MKTYSVYLETEKAKYNLIDLARRVGAELQSVSGCGAGYYVSIKATPGQADAINRVLTAAA